MNLNPETQDRAERILAQLWEQYHEFVEDDDPEPYAQITPKEVIADFALFLQCVPDLQEELKAAQDKIQEAIEAQSAQPIPERNDQQ